MKHTLISLIAPCYNEKDNLLDLYKRIRKVFNKLSSYDFELILVDNQSTDNSEQIYMDLAKKDRKVKVILMSRNFGSPQPSYLAGLKYAKGEAAVLLQGDIQDPPELIPEFIKKWREGNNVVYGIRRSRKGYGKIMNLLYKGFYFMFQKLSYVSAPLNAGDFSLIDRVIIDELLALDEFDYYLRFLRAYIGHKQTGIEYDRDPRLHGKTNESLFSSLMWAKTFIVNFSFKPLEWISAFAFLVMIMTIALFVINFFGVLLYPGAPKGIPTIVLLILFLGAVQLLSLSVIAEYLAKIFLEVKRRPRYIIKRTININGKNK